MHFYFIGNALEAHWTQMANAIYEKTILLADNFSGDFQYRLRTLFEAAGQPVGVLQAFCDKGLVFVAARTFCDNRLVSLVDQNFGKRVRVQLNTKASIRKFANKNIRD